MGVEHRNRRRGLEVALIFAAWAVFGLLVANQSSMLSALAGLWNRP